MSYYDGQPRHTKVKVRDSFNKNVPLFFKPNYDRPHLPRTGVWVFGAFLAFATASCALFLLGGEGFARPNNAPLVAESVEDLPPLYEEVTPESAAAAEAAVPEPGSLEIGPLIDTSTWEEQMAAVQQRQGRIGLEAMLDCAACTLGPDFMPLGQYVRENLDTVEVQEFLANHPEYVIPPPPPYTFPSGYVPAVGTPEYDYWSCSRGLGCATTYEEEGE